MNVGSYLPSLSLPFDLIGSLFRPFVCICIFHFDSFLAFFSGILNKINNGCGDMNSLWTPTTACQLLTKTVLVSLQGYKLNFLKAEYQRKAINRPRI